MANEYLKALSGNEQEKKDLFDLFTAKLLSGQTLTDAERAMFEFLKKDLLGESDGV